MAETYHPPLTEEHCSDLIRSELARRVPPVVTPRYSLDDVETLLRAAENRAKPRTELPSALNRFPLSWSPWLRNLILKIHKRLFHDQRAVNTVLIQALRESLAINRYLLHRLGEGPSAATEDSCES